jgi:hypothetical protein
MFNDHLLSAVHATIRAAFLRFGAIHPDFLQISLVRQFSCHLENHIRGDVHLTGNLEQALHVSGLDCL